MKTILILDDQYTPTIYKKLSTLLPEVHFPIVVNITNPMKYCELLKQVDVVLLDNYFPGRDGGREEPLGTEVLEYLMKYDYKTPIVCISDYQQKILEKYDTRKKADQKNMIYGFPGKDPYEIAIILQTLKI